MKAVCKRLLFPATVVLVLALVVGPAFAAGGKGGGGRSGSSGKSSSGTSPGKSKGNGPKPGTAAHARSQPGKATMQSPIPHVTGRWLRGTYGNAGKMPGQVADKLKGQQFKSFDHFRQELWKHVAADPHLKKQFSAGNVKRMEQGLAPYAAQSQHLGKRKTYEIHHNKPIHSGGGVYDLHNMTIVTPRFHKEVLDPKVHFGKAARP